MGQASFLFALKMTLKFLFFWKGPIASGILNRPNIVQDAWSSDAIIANWPTLPKHLVKLKVWQPPANILE